MEHMNKKFPKGNDLLREHKESTLEKAQAKRDAKSNPKELNVASKYNLLQIAENKRLKRKQALMDAMNKIHDPDFVQ
jgi:hypothetical protein